MASIRKNILAMLALPLCLVGALYAATAWNPAAGIYIQRIGSIYDSEPTSGTLYYTRYGNVSDRVKSVDFYYDGQGYFELRTKDTICTTNGADGIIHHPDGDLLIAGQGQWLHKVNKAGGSSCVVKSVECANCTAENYHLMMDPSNEYLWALGIPGPLIRYPTSNSTPGRLGNGTKMPLNGARTTITTLAWDHQGTTFYTASDYTGKNGQFGTIDMSTFKTTKLFDVAAGAHGMTFDEYSKTIFIFGGSHIIQIDPISREILADLDMTAIGFTNISWPNEVDHWRFDQGTVDGKGHLLVASNSGHLVFIDYTSNVNRRIDNNILVHAQFLDHWLDDVAPLSGVGSPRSYTSANSGLSSSSRVYSSSSYATVSSSSSAPASSSSVSSSGTGSSNGSSSSSGTGGGASDSGTGSSSSGTGGGASDSGTGSSSSGTGGGASDSGTGSSSSGTGGGASDSGTGSSSSGTGGGASDSGTSSSSSGTGGGASDSGTSSSSSGTGGGASDSGTSSSSSGTGGGASDSGTGSSSSGTGGGASDSGTSSSSGGGAGANDAPWCKTNPNAVGCSDDNSYGGADDYDVGSGTDYDQYPSNDARDKGDSTISGAEVLIPVAPGTPTVPGEIVIGGNRYVPGTTTGTPIVSYLPSFDSDQRRDSIPVGMVVAIGLDPDKLKDYLGWDPGDSLIISGTQGLGFIDPANPSQPSAQIVIKGTDFWVTAQNPVNDGIIYITGPNGQTIIFDGVSFYDPIPAAKVALLKDPDLDGVRDAIEVVLADTIPKGYQVSQVQLVVDGVPYVANQAYPSGERIEVDVSNVKDSVIALVDSLDKVLVTYTNASGVNFVREVPIRLATGQVIRRALVLRDNEGVDSLFVEFNFTVYPTDLAFGDMMVQVKPKATAVVAGILADKVRLPSKELVLFESVTSSCAAVNCAKIAWGTSLTDSIRLSSLAAFQNMPYITSEEYNRMVPIEVVTRMPAALHAEYYDTDGDGTMDSVVVQMAKAVEAKELAQMYFAFPWYSTRNRIVQLQPRPEALVYDAADPTRIGWKVQSNVTLRPGLTSIPADLPMGEVYINYDVFGNAFQENRTFTIQDKMAPAVVDARMRYSENGDSLLIAFSEPVAYNGIGLDLFDYIHGKDTLHLEALDIFWNADGLSCSVLLAGGKDRVMPGDSLLLVTGIPGKVVVDALGNMPVRNPTPLVIQGSLSHLVQTTEMGSFDPSDEYLDTVSAVTISYVPGTIRTKDLREKGELGHIIELGQRFVPQLVDNAQSQDGQAVTLDPSKVSIALQVQYYDHVGQFVTDTTIVIPCQNPKFGGNCLDTDQKLFVNWNYKDKGGRFVGSGVYLVHFKLLVSYEKQVVQEEMLDKWGVRRKKK